MKTFSVLFLFALSIVGVFAAVSARAATRVPYVRAHVSAPPLKTRVGHAAAQALEALDAQALSQQARLQAALSPHR